MSIIFLDESGFTGQDLLNLDQPVFTLATLHCPELQCEELKSTFFKDVKLAELKHSKLIRSPKYQRRVLEFLQELSQTPEIVKISISHKRYVLTAKMVELLVDPAAYEDGLDLDANGAAFELTNLLYTVLPVLGGEGFFDDLLRRFQNMIRNLDHTSYIHFLGLSSKKSFLKILILFSRFSAHFISILDMINYINDWLVTNNLESIVDPLI